MTKKVSLREFQAHLASRLSGDSKKDASGLLGIQSGAQFWLLNLSDSGEIIPLPALVTVPLAKPWFVGLANVRGNMYAVTDFSAFQGNEVTAQNADSRLLLIGTRHSNNAALLVTRVLGLRNVNDLEPMETPADAALWHSQSYADKEGRSWRMLDVKKLLANEAFMNIGV